MCACVIVANGPTSELVKLTQYLVPSRKSSILHVPSVENIAGIDLDIVDLKLRLAINYDLANVIFLTTLFSIEVGLVKDETDLGILWNVFGGLVEPLVVINSSYTRDDVTPLCFMSIMIQLFYANGRHTIFIAIIRLGYIAHSLQLPEVMDI